jgi:hypothetical protein
MRAPAADYLEADKIEELADDLSREGYRVEREATVGGQRFDLLAQRDGERLVFEVRARSRLGANGDELVRLRAAAIEAGVTGFRLVVVNPPRATQVAIEGLDAALLGYFREELPAEVDQISYETRAKRVKIFDVESVDVRRDRMRVQGRGGLDVELNYRGKTDQIDLTTDEGLDFTFDVELGSDLKLAHVNSIKVDVSDFADSDE